MTSKMDHPTTIAISAAAVENPAAAVENPAAAVENPAAAVENPAAPGNPAAAVENPAAPGIAKLIENISELLGIIAAIRKDTHIVFVTDLSDEVENSDKEFINLVFCKYSYLIEELQRNVGYTSMDPNMDPNMKVIIQKLVKQFIDLLSENIDSILASKGAPILSDMTNIVVVLTHQFCSRDIQNTDVLLVLAEALRYITRHNKTNKFVNGAVAHMLRKNYTNPQIMYELVCCMHNILYSANDITVIYKEYIVSLIKGLETHHDIELQKEILSVCQIIILKVEQLKANGSVYIMKKRQIYDMFLHFVILAFDMINKYHGNNNELVKSYLSLLFKLFNSTERILSHCAAKHNYFQMMKRLIDTYNDESTISFQIRQLALKIVASLANYEVNYPEYCEAFSYDYFVGLVHAYKDDYATQRNVLCIFMNLSLNKGTQLYKGSTKNVELLLSSPVDDSIEDYFYDQDWTSLNQMIRPINDCDIFGINFDRFLMWLIVLGPSSEFTPGTPLKIVNTTQTVEPLPVIPTHREIGPFLLEFLGARDETLKLLSIHAIVNMATLYPEVFKVVRDSSYLQTIADTWASIPEPTVLPSDQSKRSLLKVLHQYSELLKPEFSPELIARMVGDLETNPDVIRYIIYIANIPKYHHILLENNIIPRLVQLLNTSQVMNEDIYLCLLLLAKNFSFTDNSYAVPMHARYCTLSEDTLKIPDENKKPSFPQDLEDILEKEDVRKIISLFILPLVSDIKLDLSHVKYCLGELSDHKYNIIKMLIWCGVKILPGSGTIFKNPMCQNLLPLYQRIQADISKELSW